MVGKIVVKWSEIAYIPLYTSMYLLIPMKPQNKICKAVSSRVAIRPEVLFPQYISYFSDDVMKVEFESWSGSAKSVHAATRSNSSAQRDHSSMVQMVDRVWEW